ncbi:MAG TPA: Rieske (2Fe-2S) protein [Nocardioides sp.]|nr:Rieske (2Fe-2S) protein [Nocardioides sp.]
MDRTGISRRGALTGASLGLTLPVLAACGDDEPDAASDSSSPSGRSSEPESPQSPTSEAPSESPTTKEKKPKADRGIAATADVPVGGGLVLAEQKLVITQPTKGDFKGFTAVCTHQGCLVDDVTDTINCPCHGSAYSIEDGSVVGGPAPSPLAEEKLVVEGGSIDLA